MSASHGGQYFWATYGTLFRNARSTPDFCQATIFLKVYLFLFFFHAKLTKSIEQPAILKIVLASTKKTEGKKRLKEPFKSN